MSSEFVLDILRSQDLDISESTCDLTAMFSNIKVLDSTTSSSTIQVIAKIKDQGKTLKLFEDYIQDAKTEDIFIKIGFYEKGDNSATVERMIYNYLKKLLWNMRTPNIMRYIAGFECNEFYTFLQKRERIAASGGLDHDNHGYYNRLLERLEDLRDDNQDIDINHVVITIIELGKGMSFNDLLTKGIQKSEFLEIMFQTFYTLRELFLNKVRHNDVHLGNVWINVLPQPQRMIYFINEDLYVVLETKYLVKIYDFDRSGFTMGPISNSALKTSFCPSYGMCENENERYDLTIVLHALDTVWSRRYDFVRDFVSKTFINKDILDTATFPGRYCEPVRGTSSKKKDCSDKAVIKKDYVYNLVQIFARTDIFEGYTRALSTNGFEKRDVPINSPIMLSGIPMYAFKTNFYVSTKCKLTPIQMANKVLNMVSPSPKKNASPVERKSSPSPKKSVSPVERKSSPSPKKSVSTVKRKKSPSPKKSVSPMERKISSSLLDSSSESSSESTEESTEEETEESDHRFDEEIIDTYEEDYGQGYDDYDKQEKW